MQVGIGAAAAGGGLVGLETRGGGERDRVQVEIGAAARAGGVDSLGNGLAAMVVLCAFGAPTCASTCMVGWVILSDCVSGLDVRLTSDVSLAGNSGPGAAADSETDFLVVFCGVRHRLRGKVGGLSLVFETELTSLGAGCV